MAYEFAQFPVTSHTRHVGPGTTFVVVKGYKEDGLCYVPTALQKGATTIVVEHDVLLSDALQDLVLQHNATVMRVDNARKALAELSAQAHGFPADKLTIIGITGTKGKSTTTFLLAHILQSAGLKTAFLSTVKNCINGVDYATELTTQHPDYIHAFLRHCVDAGVTHVVMEVAAQAFTLHRTDGISFAAGMFLNFSLEHSEFYATQDDYFAAKVQLIRQLKPGAPFIVPADDAAIMQVAATHQGTMPLMPVSAQAVATLEGISFVEAGHEYSCSALIGSFNIMNARAALAVAFRLGVTPAQVQKALATFAGVPGRLVVNRMPNGAIAFIDYAHNPLSFERVLGAMRNFTDHMIVISGAGGDRDAAKRPLMGEIAARLGDLVILTTDNPRSEDPAVIVQEMQVGIVDPSKVVVELDREKAIKLAYSLSRPGGIIMLLGKGPDEYQLIQGVKIPFSERAVLEALSKGS